MTSLGDPIMPTLPFASGGGSNSIFSESAGSFTNFVFTVKAVTPQS